MPLPRSALSIVATQLRSLLGDNIAELDAARVLISNPKTAFEMAENKNQHFLNLFFYEFVRDGYPADGASEDPFYLRVRCLITALGYDDSNAAPTEGVAGASAGENDLRLLGEVMRLLHQNQTMTVSDNGDDFAQLQVTLYPLSLEALNHLWSTQTETPYRLSVAYEMALVPVPLARPVDRAPRVGSLGAVVRVGPTPPAMPAAGYAVDPMRLQVPRMTIDTDCADWQPHIAFVVSGNELQYAVAYDVAALPAQLNLLIAGAVGETVQLQWEIWSASAGWQPRESTPSDVIQIATDTIAPDDIDPAHVRRLALPLSDAGQALLYAIRERTRPGAAPIRYRSNPLLVTVFGTGGP